MTEKLLLLSPPDCPLRDWLTERGESVVSTSEKIDAGYVRAGNFFFLISYGYRYILRPDVLRQFDDRAINLHIAYLPWNRGADPNLWSFLEDTPKGVTIHYLDSGVDTGDIIAQQSVSIDRRTDTLATSYHRLHAAMQALFKQHWPQIKTGRCGRVEQAAGGSSHRLRDKDAYAWLLSRGWDTPVSEVEGYAADAQMSSQYFT